MGHTAFATRTVQEEKTASRRRDFTVNALMIHLFSGELLDFWGGLEDLRSGSLRHIDDAKFAEDSLRVLRAMQFAARLAFRIDADTVRLCRHIPLSDLSKERVFAEFEKLFRACHPHYGLYYGLRLDIFDKLFGLNIGFAGFLCLSRDLCADISVVEPAIREFYFLYALHNLLHLRLEPILQKLNAPTRYRRMLLKQKRRPKKISDRFLKALSLHYPLKEWLGANETLIARARALGIYERAFNHGIDIQTVIGDGFEREAIRYEFKRRVCDRLRKDR
jgi:tRNA nucleotidyltransferase (CCA-adding enzyme)